MGRGLECWAALDPRLRHVQHVTECAKDHGREFLMDHGKEFLMGHVTVSLKDHAVVFLTGHELESGNHSVEFCCLHRNHLVSELAFKKHRTSKWLN